VTTSNWASATQATGEPAPHVAGTAETFVVGSLSSSTTYYFALKTADEVPNWSGISNSPSGTTAAAATNLLTDGDFQGTGNFLTSTYTAGSSTDGAWYATTWARAADAGDGGTGDTAAKTNNNWNDVRLFQGVTAPANGTAMTLSFKYVRPGGTAGTVKVMGLTAGQQVSPSGGGAAQGTALLTYALPTQSAWTTVSNQAFTVSGTFAKLVVYVVIDGDANAKVDDFILLGS
jgi:hypothetical protein